MTAPQPHDDDAAQDRPRILFVAEAVTLAQVVRLYTLARGLDARRYEVHFASARFDERVFAGDEGFRRWPIESLAPEIVDKLVASGKRIYDERTLAGYVEEEQALLQSVRPALVVGDLRLSLAVSAPLAGVPHAALINAYWSPHAVRDGFPLPDHPIVRLLGERVAARYFPIALPKVFDHFARPLNQLRRKNGLPPVGSLPEALLHGDYTLFPDVPALVPTVGAPARHRYLGPVPWAPAIDPPAWWDAFDPVRPIVYVTLGSSGRADRLPLVLDAIRALGLQAMVATAGRSAISDDDLPPDVHAADLLPGDLAARRARLVICNGGSSTGYQALAEGRPVIGIASNLDQYLAMTAIEKAGAGRLLRAGSLTVDAVKNAIVGLLDDPGPHAAARALAAEFARWDSRATFRAFVDEVVTRSASDSPILPSP
jgi:UDP:flavonoid glycosyltransferase YjiC (YdhE family)